MALPAVGAAHILLAAHCDLRRVTGSDHAFCPGRKFDSRKLWFGVQAISKPDDLNLRLLCFLLFRTTSQPNEKGGAMAVADFTVLYLGL